MLAPRAGAQTLPSPRDFTDPAEYDAALRRAWRVPELRNDAAAALWRMHEHPRFELPTDDARVEALRRRLGPRFTLTRTPRYLVLSDASPRWTRNRLALLDRTRHQFFRFTDQIVYPALPPRARLVCVLFAEHDDYRRFAAEYDRMNAPWAGGYFSLLSNHIVLYDDRTGPDYVLALAQLDEAERKRDEYSESASRAHAAGREADAETYENAADDIDRQIREARTTLETNVDAVSTAKVVHEAAHQLAFNTGVQPTDRESPFWLTEGLASAFETADAGSSFGPRFENAGKLAKLRELIARGGLPDLPRLVARTEPADDPEHDYTAAWALFTEIARHKPESLRDYLDDLNTGPARADHAEGFRLYFGDPASYRSRLARR